MFIPFDDLYQGDLRLQESQLFSDAASRASAETQESIRMKTFVFLLPSLRIELFWIFKMLGVVVVSPLLDHHKSSFKYGNILYQVILLG